MSESIQAVTTGPTLYHNYTNHKKDISGVRARLKQRLKWWNQYQKNGSCKNKLIKCGVLVE